MIDFWESIGGVVTFRERPVPLAPEFRPQYRMYVLLVMLQLCGRAKGASLLKLHTLNWLWRNDSARRSVRAWLDGKLSLNSITVRFEPSFMRAVDFAIADGLIARKGGSSVVLTDKGSKVAVDAIKEEVIPSEVKFFQAIGKRITENELRSKADQGVLL